jgi:Icc-related predicted phosphoesterase
MKIWVLSDIHCELTLGWDLPPASRWPEFDTLVMAGDLMPRMEHGVEWLRKRFIDRPVVYVAGNHEAYRCDIDRTREKAKEAATDSNVFVLENETIALHGTRFIAGTLWTDFQLFGAPDMAMRTAAEKMNDYRLIRTNSYSRQLRPVDTLSRHMITRSFIESELAKPFSGPTVIVTHHAPYRGAIRRGHEQDILSAAYVSDLSEIIERYQPALWIYGHTHQSDDTCIARTRVVSNAKGYGPYPRLGMKRWENPNFDQRLTIVV